VDLANLRMVTVDSAARLARVEAGAPLAAVYAALAAKRVALAAGSCPTVGVAGLTLGGGLGVLSRAFGLTCDAVRSVEVVTADGRARTVGAASDPDLFWALRGGGGGSFGVVTAFTFAVRPAPTVHTFFYEWPGDRAEDVLDAWQDWADRLDRRAWSTGKLLARAGDGTARATVSGTWIGPASGLDGILAPLLAKLGKPADSARNTLSYGDAMLLEAGCYGQTVGNCLIDALKPSHREAFAATSSILATALPAAGIGAAAARMRAGLELSGANEAGVSFDVLGGAVADVAPDETAFPHRTALGTVQYTATWARGSTPAGPYDAYVRDCRTALRPWLGDAAYVNYADPAITDFGRAYWGDNYARLREVKRAVDPAGLFTFPQAV
jgi:FAD/FMN-containing dehydrogenase